MASHEQFSFAEITEQKRTGAYFTPESVAESLVSWAVRKSADRMLDPSCGDGRFLAFHKKSVGIEREGTSAALAKLQAPWALVHVGDFFTWASNTKERFECAAGNPPFIRFHQFTGEARKRALALCSAAGADFSGLSSSWAPFLVAVTSLLKPGGRVAFVVPAELGHAPYAAPLLEHYVSKFSSVQVVAVREKLFPSLSEDCWLLYADGFGGRCETLSLTVADKFIPSKQPPPVTCAVSVSELRAVWKMRLRPFLVKREARESYLYAGQRPGSFRLAEMADVNIGYVSGDNDFFHLRPSQAERLEIPAVLLRPSVRNGRALPEGRLDKAVVDRWYQQDDQMLLLRLSKDLELPGAVKRYLDAPAGQEARRGYKCRNRSPWYVVPDVKTPDFFLTYMSGLRPSLVKNDAKCACTNSVHAVRFREPKAISRVQRAWASPYVQLSCELEGHPLGGGMLKLEPREAGQILIPDSAAHGELSAQVLADALSTLRQWRHYAPS